MKGRRVSTRLLCFSYLYICMAQVGDRLTLLTSPESKFYPGLELEVIEVAPDDGRVLKAKAIVPDERLGRLGFLKEGDDYVIVEWDWCSN